MAGRIEFLSIITRDMLRVAPDARFVFGDNAERHGLGGQAREMRGEVNAIGVATKRRPGMKPEDFFDDDSLGDFVVLREDLNKVEQAYRSGLLIYVPKLGLGTGLSQLPTRAPKLYDFMCERVRDLAGGDLPWSAP